MIKEAEILAEDEMDEKVREYYIRKAKEMGLPSWEEARNILNPAE